MNIKNLPPPTMLRWYGGPQEPAPEYIARDVGALRGAGWRLVDQVQLGPNVGVLLEKEY